jgi:hypothetical protein
VKRVFLAKNVLEAHLVRMLLEERGIEAVVENEMLGQALGDLPADVSTLPAVSVFDDSRADEARRLAEERPRGTSGLDWRCPSCGETNGRAFEVCWSCGSRDPS